MNNLRELRKQKGYTQTELAKLCKTTTSNISGWECGKWQPDNENLILLADIFGVSIDFLLGRNSVTLTPEEKALGVGRKATYLSEEEWEWLELRSEILSEKGEDFLKSLIVMINAIAKS